MDTEIISLRLQWLLAQKLLSYPFYRLMLHYQSASFTQIYFAEAIKVVIRFLIRA